jgi:hypothetical protein
VNDDLIQTKMQALKTELEQAEAELAKLRPRVQYLEAICHRCDGALTVLQGLKDEAMSNHAAVVQQGV